MMAKRRIKPQADEGAWRPALNAAAYIFLALFVYAVVRYNVIKGVGVESIPLFIANKAIAVAAVVLIGLSFFLGPLARFWPDAFVPRLGLRKSLGLLGFGFAAVHSIISLVLFSPAYYPKFFTKAGTMTLEGEFSMLFGALALFIFAIVSITSLPQVQQAMDPKRWLSVQRLGYLAFGLILLHVFAMGWKGWLQPAAWPGGLPPMTLIAAVIIAFVLLARLAVMLTPRRN